MIISSIIYFDLNLIEYKYNLKPMLEVTENELFIKSDCDSLEQIEVLSFKHVDDGSNRDRRYANVLKVVSRCDNL